MTVKKTLLRFGALTAAFMLLLGNVLVATSFAVPQEAPVFKVTPQLVHCEELKQKVRVKYDNGGPKPYHVGLKRVGQTDYLETAKLELYDATMLADPVLMEEDKTVDYEVWAWRVNVEPYIISEFTSDLFTDCPTGEPPVAIDDYVTSSEHEFTVDVMANDYDPDGDELSPGSIGWVEYGKAHWKKNDKIRYTVEETFCGEVAPIYYGIWDPNGNSTIGWLHITIECN